MADRFDQFTERARRVLSYAQEEALRFNHNYIGTEHLLLGLVRERDGVAAKVLANLGVELSKVRSAVEFIIGRGDRSVLGEISLTPRAQEVIELTIDEARRLNHRYIGTEHLLLGLLREGEGIAAGILESLGVNLDDARSETERVLAGVSPTARRVISSAPPGVRRSSEEFARGLALGMALSDPARGVIEAAWTSAQALNQQRVMPQHLLLVLLQPDSDLSRSLREHGGDPDVLLAAVKRMLGMSDEGEAADSSADE